MNETQTLRDLVLKAKDKGLSFRQMEEMVAAAEAKNARGLRLNRTTASKIARGVHGGDAEDGTIRAIALVAGVPDHVAFAAAGRRTNGPPFADELPAGVDDLEPNERRVAQDLLRVLAAQRRELNRHDHDQSDRPDHSPASTARASSAKEQKMLEQLREHVIAMRDYLASDEFREADAYAEEIERLVNELAGINEPVTDMSAVYARTRELNDEHGRPWVNYLVALAELADDAAMVLARLAGLGRPLPTEARGLISASAAILNAAHHTFTEGIQLNFGANGPTSDLGREAAAARERFDLAFEHIGLAEPLLALASDPMTEVDADVAAIAAWSERTITDHAAMAEAAFTRAMATQTEQEAIEAAVDSIVDAAHTHWTIERGQALAAATRPLIATGSMPADVAGKKSVGDIGRRISSVRAPRADTLDDDFTLGSRDVDMNERAAALAARTRRPGIPPADDGGAGVGEQPDPDGPEDGA